MGGGFVYWKIPWTSGCFIHSSTCVNYDWVLVTQSCLSSLWSHGVQSARLLCLRNSPGKNTGMGSHSLLRRIFPTWEWNPGLLQCSQILYYLSHQGSPKRRDAMFKLSKKWAELLLTLNKNVSQEGKVEDVREDRKGQ